MSWGASVAVSADADESLQRSLCVVLHDVGATNLEACERLLQAVGEVAPVPLTLLAVPRYHCAPSSESFGRWLASRADAGDEVALHGYTHQDDGTPRGPLDRLRRRVYTRGEGEFCDLTLTEATRRLTAGRRWLARHRLVARGFVAPAWLMNDAAWEALRWQPFAYTCTLRRLVLLPERLELASQALTYSSENGWRRQASRAWNAGLARTLRPRSLMRLELHPGDAEHRAVRRSWQSILASALADRRATTLGVVAEQLRVRTDWDSFDSAPFSESWPAGGAPQGRGGHGGEGIHRTGLPAAAIARKTARQIA